MASRLRAVRRLLPRSVRARAGFAAGLAATVLCLGAAGWLRHVVYAERMRATEQSARQVLYSMRTTLVGTPYVDPDDLTVFVSFSPDGPSSAYVTVSADGRVFGVGEGLGMISQDRSLLPAPPPGPVTEHGIRRTTVHVGAFPPELGVRFANRTYPVLYLDMELDTPLPLQQLGYTTRALVASPVRLYVFVTPFEAERAVATIDRLLIPGVPAAVLLVAATAWLATDRALRPVERMRAQAAEFTANALDRRLSVPDSDDHISRLAVTFNDTLDRLAGAARRQRRFIADAAHELRSPIGGVRAILEVAAAHPDRADHPAVVREAIAEIRRLSRLADDLLLLARLEAAAPARATPVDLAALARAHVADRGRLRGMTVTCHARATAVVLGDPGQLDRLLTNLLDNAERHARHVVDVSVHVDDGDAYLVLAVADDGAGVAPADRERIFQPFTRLDDARTRDDGGTGLGLAISRDICVRHGGSLTVVDAALGGAGFVARLPRP